MTTGALEGRICRAARAILNWPTSRLSRESGVTIKQVFDVERDRCTDAEAHQRLTETFDRADVVILRDGTRGIGVSLRLGDPTRVREAAVRPCS